MQLQCVRLEKRNEEQSLEGIKQAESFSFCFKMIKRAREIEAILATFETGQPSFFRT